MSLSDKLQFLGFEPEIDYVLEDNGSGPYISIWKAGRPQPQPAALNAIDNAVAVAKAKELKAGRQLTRRRELRAVLAFVLNQTGQGPVTADTIPQPILDEFAALLADS